jgi:hypothetical protein
MESNADVDAMIADAVKNIRDRFGSEGLREMIAVANTEIGAAEQAESVLRDVDASTGATPAYDSADTQAWIAYTGHDADGDGE